MYRLLGEIDVLEGQDREATARFRRALEVDERRADARRLLANALARQGEFEEAEIQYGTLIEALSEDTELLVRRGSVRVNLGKRALAYQDFERALELEPSNELIRERLAEAYRHFGEAGRAEELSPASRSESAASVSLARGKAAFLKKDWLQANSELTKVIDAVVLAAEPERAEAHLLLARLEGHRENYLDSVRHFDAVLATNPRHPGAWRGKIAALVLSRQFEGAREELRQALEIFPRDVSLAHALSRLLASSPDKALRNGVLSRRLAERLLQVAPSTEISQTLAMALAELGEFEAASKVQAALVNAEEEGQAAAKALQERRLAAYRSQRSWAVESLEEILVLLR